MDLRTRYSELTMLTSQYIKFISETLRRMEEEEVRRGRGRGGGGAPAAQTQPWGLGVITSRGPPLPLPDAASAPL